MSLADELKQINQKEQDMSSNNVEYPSSKLKHYPISLSRKNPTIAVRILPATSPKAHTWEPYRQLWTQDNKGKSHSYFVSADSQDTKDPLLQALKRWDSVEFDSVNKDGKPVKKSGLWKVDKKYGKYPSLRYYINVIPLESTTNKEGIPVYVEKRDEQGNPDVYMMSINFGLLNNLATNLQDSMHNPNLLHKKQIDAWNAKGANITQEQIDNSFISDIFAYPVVFNRVEANNNVTYSIEIDQSDVHILKPLKRGWEKYAEDLAYQATPSYVYNSKWVNSLINNVDKELGTLSHVNPPQQQQPLGQSQQQSKPTTYQKKVTDNKETVSIGKANSTSTVAPSSAPAGDPFPENYTSVGVPNTTSRVKYGTQGVYEMGSISLDDDDDMPKDDTKDTSVAQTLPASSDTQGDNEFTKVFNDIPDITKGAQEHMAVSTNDSVPTTDGDFDFSSIPADDMPKAKGNDNKESVIPVNSQAASSQTTPAPDDKEVDKSVEDIMKGVKDFDDTGLFN